MSQEQIQKMESLGIDWQKLLSILDKAPVVIALLKQLITLFADDQPVMANAHHDDDCCDHKELCLRTLQSALCAACCAAKHYEVCCSEHCDEG